MSNDYLAHYGVKGMKWGVRRSPQKKAAKTRAKNKRKALNKQDLHTAFGKSGAGIKGRAKALNSYIERNPGKSIAATTAASYLGLAGYTAHKTGAHKNAARSALAKYDRKRARFTYTDRGRKPTNKSAQREKLRDAMKQYSDTANNSARKWNRGVRSPSDHEANYIAMKQAQRYMTAYQGVKKARKR